MSTGKRWAIVVLIALVILFFLFLRVFREDASPSGSVSPENCLIFQGDDASEPCYSPNMPGSGGSMGSGGLSQAPSSSSAASASSTGAVLSPSASEAVSSCASPVSIERDDCVKSAAVERKDPTICSAIKDPSGRADCSRLVSSGPEKTKESFSLALKSYDFSNITVISQAATSSLSGQKSLTSIFSDMLESIRARSKEARENPDSRLTAEGFFERLKAAPLALFSFSRFQAAPGTELSASGFGFTETGNEIHIGNYAVPNIPSPDSMTLRFILPGSMENGTYEAWVTNERGSSRNARRPIQIVITDSPLPPPTITGISPSVPTLSDTVTIYGAGFRGALGLYTSLGVLENIHAGDSSVTFKISDFELIDRIKDVRGVKGNIIPVSLVIGTPQGYNQEPFTFNVQF